MCSFFFIINSFDKTLPTKESNEDYATTTTQHDTSRRSKKQRRQAFHRHVNTFTKQPKEFATFEVSSRHTGEVQGAKQK
jgi:hypothetical protein